MSDRADRDPALPQDRADRLPRVPWAAVVLFVVVAFGLAWAVALPLWLSEEFAASPFAPLVPAAMMFTPALAACVVVLLARVPRERRLAFLGMWPLRPAKRVVWFTVASVFAPLLLTSLATLLAAALGWVQLDLVHFSGYAEMIAATTPADVVDMMPPAGLLVALQLALIPLAALLNSILAFGEEVGWRGWLLSALRPLGTWPALILSGAIWGLWHMPVTLLGHNYGLTDWRGVALMTTSCVVLGVLFGWSRLRSGSVWPAVVGHGALNASGGLILLVAAAGETPDMALGSVMGVAGWIVCATVALVLALTGQFRVQPALAGSHRGR